MHVPEVPRNGAGRPNSGVRQPATSPGGLARRVYRVGNTEGYTRYPPSTHPLLALSPEEGQRPQGAGPPPGGEGGPGGRATPPRTLNILNIAQIWTHVRPVPASPARPGPTGAWAGGWDLLGQNGEISLILLKS